VKDQLFCTNNDCGVKTEKKIRHFVTSLKIKGFGPVTISKLNLSGLLDIYTLTLQDIILSLSSEKLAIKLFNEIENSKKASLNLLLPAFSIPLIGKTATEKLSTVCSTIYDITECTCRNAGLGPKATENILTWKRTEFPILESLPFNYTFKQIQQPTQIKGVVCISGKLQSVKTKAEAEKILRALGYIVKSSVTKDVTFLINESGIESAKTLKARNSGVIIVTNLKDLIGEKI